MESVQVVVEDETRVTRPEVLMEAVSILTQLREFGNLTLVLENDHTVTRIEVQTTPKKSFWKRLWKK